MITKEHLIRLFEAKDSSRKRSLYKLYKDYINSDSSRAFIARVINTELKRPGLVTVADIKYCRLEFAKKEDKVANERKTINPIKVETNKNKEVKKISIPDLDIQISDPDEIMKNKNILKSKHSIQ